MNFPLISTALLLTTITNPAFSQDLNTNFLTDGVRYITAAGETDTFTWEGTNQGLGIIKKRNNKRKFLTKENSKLPDNYITSIACLADGQTYIGTKNGILLWDNYSFFLYNTENCDLPENNITSMTLDGKENLIIRTPNCGLSKAIGHCIKLFKIKRIDQ